MQYEPHIIALLYLFVSLPWTVGAVYCPLRYASLCMAIFGICRVVYGPWFLHKIALMLYEMSAVVYVR